MVQIKDRDGRVLWENKKRTSLIGADLSGTNLFRADLSGTNLFRADLRGADLVGADLGGAKLSGAKLSGANLSGANLSGAVLRWANLSGADLFRADLQVADLSGADLREADLSGTNLFRADLRGADLSGAELREANLSGAKYDTFSIEVGNIYYKSVNYNGKKITSPTHDTSFEWKVGETYTCKEFNDDVRVSCAKGFHLFPKAQAMKWEGNALIKVRVLKGKTCVPISSDGKFRVEKLEVLEVILKGDIK